MSMFLGLELERRSNGKREHEQRKECKGGNSGNIGKSGKRKYDEGAKVGVEGRGCGHVLDHRIMLLCPGWVGALGITMVDTLLWVLPWTRVGTVNIPWIDTGTKVVREVEHGGRFINISSTARRVAQGISARCSMEAQCWGSILEKLQVKYFLEDSVWLNISLTMKIPTWSLVKMNDLNLLKALLAKNRFLV